MSELTLKDRVIAIPESRELDIFAALLERRGARVLRCPLISIHDAPDPAPVLAWIDKFNSGACTDLILLTGEGLRRLLSCIDQHRPQFRDPFIQALTHVRKITRGPKPARVLRDLGMQSDIAAEVATTDGVIDALKSMDLRGRRFGVQLYGTDPNERLIQFLCAAGADTLPVAPYIYASRSEDAAIGALAEQLAHNEVDAMAFTSMQQVTRWFDVLGEERARNSLRHTMVAAVGPIVAESLQKRGVKVALVPQDAYFLKPLTRALEESFKKLST